ncbi:hypothetical protein BaRGS_00011785, partial [Batillaria attramentaria]
MDHSVPSTEETGRTSSLLWRSALNRENNNSNETICVGPGERDGPLIRVLRIEAKIDNEPTHIDETSPAVLKYRTPNFRASATVEISPGVHKLGSMISDCDGRHYPWYGSRNETVIFKGPCDRYQTATVFMNDNFHPHVTWRNPANRHQLEPNLTHIVRDQSFYVWLVAWNMVTMKSFVLQTISWRMQLEIEVEPTNPLGQRARLVSNPVPTQPSLLDYNVPIPRCALTPPCANSAQMLVWHPRRGRPVCVIPPVWKTEAHRLKRDSKLHRQHASCIPLKLRHRQQLATKLLLNFKLRNSCAHTDCPVRASIFQSTSEDTRRASNSSECQCLLSSMSIAMWTCAVCAIGTSNSKRTLEQHKASVLLVCPRHRVLQSIGTSAFDKLNHNTLKYYSQKSTSDGMGAVMLVLATVADSSSSPGDLKPNQSAITNDLPTGITQHIWTDSIQFKGPSELQELDLHSDAKPFTNRVSKHFGPELTGVNLSIAAASYFFVSDHHETAAEPSQSTATPGLGTKATTASSPEKATALPHSTTPRSDKKRDVPFTETEPGLWRLNFSVCSNWASPWFKWFHDGDTVETLFELHPDDERSYDCNLAPKVGWTEYITVVVEEFQVLGNAGKCIADFAWLAYDDHNRQVGRTYPCEESFVIAADPREARDYDEMFIHLKMAVNDRAHPHKTNETVAIFWKFSFYYTDYPGYKLVDHVQATTSQHAGHITNFLFNGKRHYSTFTNAFFSLRIRALEVLMISFLHFDIDCTQGKLQFHKRTSENRLDSYNVEVGFLLFPYLLDAGLRYLFVRNDTRCGTEPIPPKLYNVSIGIRFYSGAGKTASGFKLQYSIHNATEAPQSLGANLYNCSVPYYPSFQQHLQCNLVVQCQGGEDEIDCPYTTADCGLGLIDAGDKCYKYIEERREITWYDAFDKCMEQNARLVSPQTPTEWKAFQEVLLFGMNSSALYVGLQTSESSLGLMYREVWQWADRTMAYFNRALIQSQLPKPACAFLPPVYREIFSTTICGLPMRMGFVLCEFEKHVVANLQYKPSEMNDSSEWEEIFVRCPNGHIVPDFLSCDVASDCSAESYLASCWTPAAGNIHMFVCDASLQTLPYTLVCDHREDCPGGSDEGFCVYQACPQRQCRNGQCVTFDQWCDNMAHCVDGSDEECPVPLQARDPSVPPPAVVTFDGF